MKKVAFILCICFLFAFDVFANKVKIDSLNAVISSPNTHDTNVVRAYIDLAGFYYLTNPDTAISFCQDAAQLSENIDYKYGMGQSYGWLGYLLEKQGEIDSAISYHGKSIVLSKASKDTLNWASALNNIAYIYKKQGDIKQALTNYNKCLLLFEKIGNDERTGTLLNNIGQIYSEQGEYDKALKNLNTALDIFERINSKRWIALVHNNIGILHKERGNDKRALEHYYISLQYNRKANNPQGVGLSCNNIGQQFLKINLIDSATKYFELGLINYQSVNNARGIALCKGNLAVIYHKKGRYSQGLKYANEAMEIAREIGFLASIKNAAKVRYKLYKSTGNAKEALDNYKLFIQMRDSILSKQNQKEVLRQQYKFEYEKKAAADSVKAAEEAKLKDAQLAAQKAQNTKQKQQAYFLYGGLALAMLFGGFIFNRFKVTQKQKSIIETQKSEVEQQREVAEQQKLEAENQKALVEEKNREIVDSIQYAKRLQEAILPPTKIVKQWLKESFILYKPKDIVAGDFYWMETVGDTVYFAAADCTGHGVPGAMVSVVCSNALSKALMEENITEPGKILDRTRELVIERFGQSEEDIKDGMDLALVALAQSERESGGRVLQYSGANNPLWIIRKDTQEVEEIKADKQPIGKYAAEKPFTTHNVNLTPGDSIYIFSDGYPDQFGGQKGKKYKSGKMKTFLLSIQDQDMATQHKLLNEEFESWRGELDQLDDVCVIGVKV